MCGNASVSRHLSRNSGTNLHIHFTPVQVELLIITLHFWQGNQSACLPGCKEEFLLTKLFCPWRPVISLRNSYRAKSLIELLCRSRGSSQVLCCVICNIELSLNYT